MRRLLAILVLLVAPPGFATPPGARDGANHHAGDDSFVAAYGREPKPGDGEKLRMHTHFTYVRAWLASRPATRPELAEKRRRLLAYFDEYIAHGITPRNTEVPKRNPVFIDHRGQICAVGYLIERTAGRAFAERIAAEHRNDYLEDIAAAMPEVREWVAASGFTLTELATMQPGYEAEISAYRPWALNEAPPPDGAYSSESGFKGTMHHGHMEGEWTHTVNGKVVGSGEFVHGAGKWRSEYPNGKLLATGHYVGDLPHGPWKLFHASGMLAAEGHFKHGQRDGTWRFYYDSPHKTVISTGAFSKGEYVGKWKHYDPKGKLFAIAGTSITEEWKQAGLAFYFDVIPTGDGVKHQRHEGGGMMANDSHMDSISSGKEHLYLFSRSPTGLYDSDGNFLVRTASGWSASECHWSAKLKQAAHAGDLAFVHATVKAGEEKCDDATRPIDADRAKRVDAMIASVKAVRVPSAQFVRELAGTGNPDIHADTEPEDPKEATLAKELSNNPGGEDFAKILADTIGWYIEWPHVDRRFIAAFQAMPGYDRPGS
jgi:hypothetical protein